MIWSSWYAYNSLLHFMAADTIIWNTTQGVTGLYSVSSLTTGVPSTLYSMQGVTIGKFDCLQNMNLRSWGRWAELQLQMLYYFSVSAFILLISPSSAPLWYHRLALFPSDVQRLRAQTGQTGAPCSSRLEEKNPARRQCVPRGPSIPGRR